MDLRYLRGFAQIQNLLERSIVTLISESKGTSTKNVAEKMPISYLQQFPFPKYKAEE
jgi:hypothetical protein